MTTKLGNREMFTLQIQGKGIRCKVRVPGWAIAPILRYAKEAERPEPARRPGAGQ